MARSEAYLNGSEHCDVEHPEILAQARSLVEEGMSPRDKARRVFYFVRDEIRFGTGSQYAKASEVLADGQGDCCITANLQAALLKALGVPARLKMTLVDKEALRAITPGWAYHWVPPVVGHCWPECQLDEQWLSCEALLDPPLVDALHRKGLIGPEDLSELDWDGKTDRILFGDHVKEDFGSFPTIDAGFAFVREKGLAGKLGLPSPAVEQWFGWLLFDVMNRHIARLRRASETS